MNEYKLLGKRLAKRITWYRDPAYIAEKAIAKGCVIEMAGNIIECIGYTGLRMTPIFDNVTLKELPPCQ